MQAEEVNMLKAKTVAIGLVLAAGGFSGVATAQNGQRFQMERSDGGFMVMDTQTGTTSFCRERGGEFVCSATSEEKSAENDIEILRKKITELEARIEVLEGGRSSALDLPSETEFEQTLNFMERFFRRFVDIVKGLETEETPPPAERIPPERT